MTLLFAPSRRKKRPAQRRSEVGLHACARVGCREHVSERRWIRPRSPDERRDASGSGFHQHSAGTERGAADALLSAEYLGLEQLRS